MIAAQRLVRGDDPRVQALTGASDAEVRGITTDWSAVESGWVYAALVGRRADGRDHIDEAIERGAVAVLAPADTDLGPAPAVPLIVDDNPHRALALMAARFHPRQPRFVAAVTGTNGKTSVVDFAAQLWNRLGRRAASLGTLGVRPPGRPLPERMTTPFPLTLHATLARLAARGTEHVALEATSIGLAEHRIDGVEITAAAFTNLTDDEHIGYHGSLDRYRTAKFRLFESLMEPGSEAVVYADSAEFDALAAVCRGRGHRLWSYGRNGAEIRLANIEPIPDGQVLTVDLLGRRDQVAIPLVGAFQAVNAVGALGLVLASGVDAEAALSAMADLRPVPGRLECVARHPDGAPILVDYAHTPTGLETVLESLRPTVTGRLVVVFGCGGVSDPAKRPRMGEIAGRLADRVIVTDDNPRTEDPAAIRAEILAECPDATEIPDRADAIEAAIHDLSPGDALLIAGKGHESWQTTAAGSRYFDDAALARSVVEAPDGE